MPQTPDTFPSVCLCVNKADNVNWTSFCSLDIQVNLSEDNFKCTMYILDSFCMMSSLKFESIHPQQPTIIICNYLAHLKIHYMYVSVTHCVNKRVFIVKKKFSFWNRNAV